MHDAVATALIDQLAAVGYAVASGALDISLCRALHGEASALAIDPDAIDAGIGRKGAHATDHAIRRARIRWMDGTTPAQVEFLATAEQMRVRLNAVLFLGLRTFEAQLALTPADGFYQRHLDSFQGARNRRVSLVAYLNEDWVAADGGALRIWSGGETPHIQSCSVDVLPVAGTLVLLSSETVPHEVLPCRRPRTSIAGWFRLDQPIGTGDRTSL
jgi:SM-20-related protein